MPMGMGQLMGLGTWVGLGPRGTLAQGPSPLGQWTSVQGCRPKDLGSWACAHGLGPKGAYAHGARHMGLGPSAEAQRASILGHRAKASSAVKNFL